MPELNFINIFKIIYPKTASYKNIYKRISKFTVFIIFIAIAATLGGIYYGVYKFLDKVNGLYMLADPLKNYLLSMISFSLFSMLILSSMVSSLSVMFTAKDLPLLFSMPLAHRNIFISKLFEISFFTVTSAYIPFVTVMAAFSNSYAQSSFLYFIFGILLVTPFFYIAPVSIGCLISLTISKIFPVNQARKVIYYFMLFTVAFLIFLFRALEPEKLMSPEKFENLAKYLLNLDSPIFLWSPSTWAADILKSGFNLNYDNFMQSLFLTFGFTALIFGLCVFTGIFIYRDCYLKYQEEQESLSGRKQGLLRFALDPFVIFAIFLYNKFIKILPSELATILDKDLKTFFRTQVMLVQSLMMLAVTALYLYNVKLLPLSTQALVKGVLDMFGYLNNAMIAFVISSYAIRFVFPMFSLEGKAFYIIKTAPVDMKKYLRLKFYSNLLPMLLFGIFLCVASNLLMGATPKIFLISGIDTFILCYFICHLNVYLGIVFPALDASVSEIPSSFGGMVSMVGSIAYTAILMMFETVIEYIYFFGHFNGYSFNYIEYAGFIIMTAIFIAGTFSIYYFPKKMAVRKLNNFYEESKI